MRASSPPARRPRVSLFCTLLALAASASIAGASGAGEQAVQPAENAFANAARSVVTLQMRIDDEHTRFGAGVIVRLRDGIATIATARHVVDAGFAAAAQSAATAPRPITARFAGGAPVAATLDWMAPHGEDLALLTAPVADPRARAADAATKLELRAGDTLWMLPRTRQPDGVAPTPEDTAATKATVREARDVVQDGYAFQLLQTDLALEPGDSGSGLYDANGRLVAIQTMRALTPPGSGGAVSFALPVRVLFDLARLPADSPTAAR